VLEILTIGFHFSLSLSTIHYVGLGLEFATQPTLALNSQSSCLSLLSPGIIGVDHHVCLSFTLEINCVVLVSHFGLQLRFNCELDQGQVTFQRPIWGKSVVCLMTETRLFAFNMASSFFVSSSLSSNSYPAFTVFTMPLSLAEKNSMNHHRSESELSYLFVLGMKKKIFLT
jgi:hypothetical protein